MRTLFKEVRKEFKERTAIRLYNQSNLEIAKSDKKMTDAGITNGARLQVSVHPSNPEVFTIFVTLPNGTHISLNLTEVMNLPCSHNYILYGYRNNSLQNYTNKLSRK